MKLKELFKYPRLQNLASEISKNFANKRLKLDAHKASHKVLEKASKNNKILSEILHYSASKSGFLSGKNPPTIGLEFFRDKNFQLIANFWIPLPQNIAPQSVTYLHHHGSLILSTVTAFGPGYHHWLMKHEEIINAEKDLFQIEMIENGSHYLHHVGLVNAREIHVPMFAPALSVTYALWSDQKNTNILDELKSIKILAKYSKPLRKVLTKIGLGNTLQLKNSNYLDFYPVKGGFKGVKNRSEFELLLEPTSDYLHSIFHIFQSTGNENIALELFTEDRINDEPFKNINDKNLATKLIKDLRRGNKINPKLTPKLHYGLSESHFTHEAILGSISKN